MLLNYNNPLSYYIGYATNAKDRQMASSGGVGTAITRYLLNQEDYGTSITFEFDQQGCMYRPKLIHSADEINVCGSVYQDIDIAAFVRHNVDRIKCGIVLSCPPCQISAVRQILNKANIKHFIISYCCSGQTTIEGTWKYYELVGVKKEDVVNMQYRGNGWPSGIQIWLKDGTKLFKDNYTEPWVSLHQSKLYAPKRCFFCTRDTGRNADISLADPWLESFKKEDKTGNTMFLTFSELGQTIVREMQQQDLLQLTETSYDDYAIAQAPNIHKEIRLKEQSSYIKKHLKLVSKQWYFNWATKDLAHVKQHNKILRYLYRGSLFTIISKFNMNVFTKVSNRLRYYRIKGKLGKSEGYISIGERCIFNNPQCIHIGKNVGIGTGSFFGPVVRYAGINYNPKIIIGESTWIGKNASIAAIDRVEIGKNVLFAGCVHITDHSHGYEDILRPMSPQPLISKGPVIIEDDCWLGFSCEILSGVHIGKHSVVAARAVVTKDVPPYSIVAGNPARIVKQYNFISKKWEKKI